MIIGGGKVGYYLAKTLAAEHHSIMVVESDPVRCQRIVRELNSKYIEFTCGDGTVMHILEEAGILRAETLIAVTGRDQNNLAACQLAKSCFGVKMTIARVNNPKNIRVFEKLGVDSVVSSTDRIAGIINQELDWSEVNLLFKARTGGVRIREALVSAGSPLRGRRLAELGLPQGLIIVSVLRGSEAIIPNGETTLEPGDYVVAMGGAEQLAEVCDAFTRE
jgi:trk system potassium uptake protein TrkA